MPVFEHTEEEQEVLVQTDAIGGHAVVLYNDEVNTFDHVIDCLIKYCDHSEEQAEQCSLIVHYKGKCSVKMGSLEDLQPVCDALCRRGLSALIEEV